MHEKNHVWNAIDDVYDEACKLGDEYNNVCRALKCSVYNNSILLTRKISFVMSFFDLLTLRGMVWNKKETASNRLDKKPVTS